ncbi:MAG TPA: glycosyltransferase [Ktedonobacteraceae bacterium]
MQKNRHISQDNDIGGSKQDDEVSGCSVGIMAYNEEANIAHTIHLVLAQHGPSLRIEEVIVVASGCTDRTVPIVAEIARQEPRVRLCIQEKREGKASAINLFLKQAGCRIVVLIGADVIPGESALENLCRPLKNPEIGMVGGRPIPINNQATFMGHAVHLLWRLHDRLARVQPKLGEVIAFRNVISSIPTGSSVDEISIQALISQLGYQTIYEPACVVYNKGPLTVRDFLKQRRRIFAGHLQVRDQQKYEASTMKNGPILLELLRYRDFTLRTPKHAIWTLGTVSLEGLARLQGYYDYLRKHEQYIWQMVESTKDLEAGTRVMRRLNNVLSVIIFRFILEVPTQDLFDPASDEREATEAVRKLLPVLRTRLHKEGELTLSINEPGIMTAIIRAEQHEAEDISRQIQEIVQTTPVRLGMRGREVRVKVAHSSLTFRADKKNITVISPSTREAAITAHAPGESLYKRGAR